MAMQNGPLPSDGIPVSHAELLDTFQKMHAEQYSSHFNSIVQLKTALAKAQAMLQEVAAGKSNAENESEKAHKEIVQLREHTQDLEQNLRKATERIAELEQELSLPVADVPSPR